MLTDQPLGWNMNSLIKAPSIKVHDLHKRYGSNEVLKGVSFEVGTGRVTAVIGSSGSGKTTMIRCINRLTTFEAGSIQVDNFTLNPGPNTVDVRALRKKVGYVFQQFNLWPHKTVLDNLITAPMIVSGLQRAEAVERARLLLERVGLSEKIKEYPSRLSGGQQQRVAIARALAMEPQILLFDEITSALDPELVDEVLRVVKQIAEEHKRTLIVVTHEMGFARDVADEVLFVDQGAIVERGKPEQIFKNPQRDRTRQFLKRTLSASF